MTMENQNSEMQDQELDVDSPEKPKQADVLQQGLLDENRKLQEKYTQSQTQLSHLLGNEHIRNILQAARDGKEFKVLVGDQAQQSQASSSPEPSEEEIDDNLSAKDIYKRLDAKLNAAISKTVNPMISEKSAIFEDQLNKLNSAIQQLHQEKAKNILQGEIAKVPDMKNYLEPMQEILTKNQDLSYSEAYWLAKSRKGEIDPLVSSGERPNREVRKLNPKDWTDKLGKENLNKKISLIAEQLLSQQRT
jgi:hypothetical protein